MPAGPAKRALVTFFPESTTNNHLGKKGKEGALKHIRGGEGAALQIPCDSCNNYLGKKGGERAFQNRFLAISLYSPTSTPVPIS
jgi:hypothetical protein